MTTITNDTICAISTAPGVGGIAVTRVSGPDAITIVSHSWTGADLTTAKPRTVHYGTITDIDGTPLDQVVVTIFRAPHSCLLYTSPSPRDKIYSTPSARHTDSQRMPPRRSRRIYPTGIYIG